MNSLNPTIKLTKRKRATIYNDNKERKKLAKIINCCIQKEERQSRTKERKGEKISQRTQKGRRN